MASFGPSGRKGDNLVSPSLIRIPAGSANLERQLEFSVWELLWFLWPLQVLDFCFLWQTQSSHTTVCWNHRWDHRDVLFEGLALGYLIQTGPLLISLSPLQRVEAKNERGLTLGLVLGFGKAAEFSGDWREGLDSSLLGLLAPSVLGAKQLPSFMCGSCQLCCGRGRSPACGSLRPSPQLWQLWHSHICCLTHPFPMGVVKRKSQELRRPHTSNTLGRNSIPKWPAYSNSRTGMSGNRTILYILIPQASAHF